MKRPSFSEGVLVALGAGLFSSVALTVIPYTVGLEWSMRALIAVDPLLYLALHLVLIWLVRSLYHQPGPLAALLDLVLNLFALMAGLWAFVHADSIFMGVWTFFLIQAMFIGINL